MGVGGLHHAPAAFTPGKDPVPIVQEAGWAPGAVWISAGNLAPTRIRSPDLLARGESLYWLRYPDPDANRKQISVGTSYVSLATQTQVAFF